MKRIEAVIFDLDGVIIDSEPLQKKAFDLTLEPFNIKISDCEFSKLIGIRTYENFVYLSSKYKLPFTPLKLTKIKNRNYLNILIKEAKPREGVVELINYLYKKYKLAIASGSIRKDVMTTLKVLGLKKYFKVILTGDDIIESKPSPEIFLKTAKKLKIAPENCLVIEDSEAGVLAAKNANMFVIAAPTNSTLSHNFKSADIVVKNLLEVKNFV
jgi:HAD superfamily hydrolase (TIGR01509 family)